MLLKLFRVRKPAVGTSVLGILAMVQQSSGVKGEFMRVVVICKCSLYPLLDNNVLIFVVYLAGCMSGHLHSAGSQG